MGNDASSNARICSFNFARTVTYLKEGGERNVDLNVIFGNNTTNLSGEESLSQRYSSDSCSHEFDITIDKKSEFLFSPSTSFSVESPSSKHTCRSGSLSYDGEASIMRDCSSTERTQTGRKISKHGTFLESDIFFSEDDVKRAGLNDELEEDESHNQKSVFESLKESLPESIQCSSSVSTYNNKSTPCRLNPRGSTSFQPEVEGSRSPSSLMMSQVPIHADPKLNPCFSEEKCSANDKFIAGTNNLSANRFTSAIEISRSNTGKSEEQSKKSRFIDKLDTGEGTISCGSVRYFPDQLTHTENSARNPNKVNHPARSKLKKSLDSPTSLPRDSGGCLSEGYDSAELVTGTIPDSNDMGSLTLCKRKVRSSIFVPSLNNWLIEGWSDKDEIAELYRENKSESESVELDDYYFTNFLTFSNNNLGYLEVEDREEEHSVSSLVSELSLLPVRQSVTF